MHSEYPPDPKDADGLEFVDAFDGTILGAAVYDAALSADEIGTHASAFATIPEPASMIMLSLGGIALIRRRRA